MWLVVGLCALSPSWRLLEVPVRRVDAPRMNAILARTRVKR